MKESREPTARKELSSGKFVKLFIKNFFLNSILVGIVLYIVYEIGKEILPTIVTTILGFVLVFAGIIKIYLSAISKSFYDGKIHQADINKISKIIVLVFVILLIVNVGLDYMSYASSLKFSKILGLEDIALKNFIINIVVNVVMYTIIAITCRIKFLKECENPDNII